MSVTCELGLYLYSRLHALIWKDWKQFQINSNSLILSQTVPEGLLNTTVHERNVQIDFLTSKNEDPYTPIGDMIAIVAQSYNPFVTCTTVRKECSI